MRGLTFCGFSSLAKIQIYSLCLPSYKKLALSSSTARVSQHDPSQARRVIVVLTHQIHMCPYCPQTINLQKHTLPTVPYSVVTATFCQTLFRLTNFLHIPKFTLSNARQASIHVPSPTTSHRLSSPTNTLPPPEPNNPRLVYATPKDEANTRQTSGDAVRRLGKRHILTTSDRSF